MQHIVILFFAFFLLSCASHKDVRPGAEGIHHVIIRGTEKAGAERKAIKQANHYCDKVMNGKHAVFVTEKSEYTGSMKEDTRNTIKKASTAAMVVGGVAGHHSPLPIGSHLGAAGAVGYIMTNGDDYTADMKFKCE